mmetsp:Transcript_20607/g.30983  ORF Transcript_20607/g.30983 Transcript_20607/m.30983 type:complete len:320 (+) Transcript_20607:42-1001(+)
MQKMPSSKSSNKKASKKKCKKESEVKKKSTEKKKKKKKKKQKIAKGSNRQEKEVPLAEILRRENKKDISQTSGEEEHTQQRSDKKPDIDDEIRRLEAELAEFDDDSSCSSSSKEQEEDEVETTHKKKRKVKFGETTVREIPTCKPKASSSKQDIICLSAVSEDRIEPLPSTSLPAISRKRNANDNLSYIQKKKRENETSVPSNNGLEKVVKEVLDGYVARSSEKLPFYCRVCAKQYSNLEEFQSHFSGEFHRAAAALERKASYCKLCRKQLTSPVQLKEHLKSKPHRERLHRVQQKQQQNTYAESRGPNSSSGNRRQWC